MMLLEGRRIVVTGVLNDDSIAFSVARLAQQHGAEVILTSFGRIMSITQRVARKLDPAPDVLELDVSAPEHHAALADALRDRWGRVDGVVHAIGFAPASALGGNFLETEWPDVATAVQVSAYSLKSLAVALADLMPSGASVVGLDFDATVAWPGYDWMGVAKAAFESCARYLARDLGPRGIRVNLVAAGPVRTVAAKSIPGFEKFEDVWDGRAPLGWDVRDASPVAKAVVALLSDLFPATTGEIIHVDGGFHAMGA
ncbi:MAG: enoyl-ACP reductase FabI [Acidimicrobiales bacterium]